MASAAAAPEVDYDKLLKLFNSPHSAELYDRHVAVVERVCRVNAKGFVSSPPASPTGPYMPYPRSLAHRNESITHISPQPRPG
jgi:hypothetical protein